MLVSRRCRYLHTANVVRTMARIFAVSDLHVDIQENLRWLESWSCTLYQNDVLIVAGDVTDNIVLLKTTLKSLTQKFAEVCYVPGNHELWINGNQASGDKDSIDKFHSVVTMCKSIGVITHPIKVLCCDDMHVWVVPLFSWYSQPNDDPGESLYVGHDSEDQELTKQAWLDNHRCKWPSMTDSPAKFFAGLNSDFIKAYDSPVISFTHFLPRLDLVSTTDDDIQQVQAERQILGLSPLNNPKAQGANIKFNFTRYAGSKRIEDQIRRLGSKVHIYGHQHRNRDRVIDGVRYASYCRGYPGEQSMGVVWGFPKSGGPKQIWP